jgi:hypothetical protein
MQNLYHHGNKEYAVAAGEAAESARKKLQESIDKGRQAAIQAISSIGREYDSRRDEMVPAGLMDFNIDPDYGREDLGIALRIGNGDAHRVGMTRHSLGQLLGRLGMPRMYAERLVKTKEPWARELLHQNLRNLTTNVVGSDRLLVRNVDGVAKGILSSSYRRMDAAPIMDTFITEGMQYGLVPADGLNTQTRYHVKMMYPEVFEPAQNEVMAFGLSLTTSDYGNGALDIQFFLMRLWCTNKAIGESCLRKIHIGRRFAGEESDIEFSQKTIDLDTKAVASATRDIIRIGMDKKIDETCRMVKLANEKGIDVKKEIEGLVKKGTLTKELATQADALYKNVNDVVLLPKGDTAWRFSNVLSLMAQNQEGDKRLDLEAAAFAAAK